ncbi:hypothetical protein EI16_04640 [Hydrogenovibrio marinus]|uniref:EfeO-type cupredoxin-like domain-containing protein n=1 Tax=Hydrogenovibrio marinus TaxID=28885 RepID=A0A066ZP53_HYDMR|nr:hypothetical protein EI16_04640 [Hydrogenovibrio marinus]
MQTLFSIFLILAFPPLASAAPISQMVMTIKNHQFSPSEIKIQPGQKVLLIIKNEDHTPEEFESYSLNREKLINGNSTAKVYIGPLEPGSYKFFGEFFPKTAKGTILVK